MIDRPNKITRQYACWRGTRAHLVQLANGVRDEINRAADAAKQKAFDQIDQQLQAAREDFVRQSRQNAHLAANDPLPPDLQNQLRVADENAQTNREMQRRIQEQFILTQARRVTFSYVNRRGQSPASSDPSIFENVGNPDGVGVRGYVLGTGANANITISIQNRPWETVSLEVEGEDPNWVSSAFLPLDSFISGRNSPPVRFLRNDWTRNAIGLALWLVFIPPSESVLRKFAFDPLFTIPASLIAAALVARIYQYMVRPLIITSREPSAFYEIARAAIGPVAGAIVAFLLRLFFG